MVKKNIERKKHLKVVEILKKFVGATMIIKCILNLKMNLTVEELLVFALAIKKQLIKAIIEDKMVQFLVNILGLGRIFEAKKPFL